MTETGGGDAMRCKLCPVLSPRWLDDARHQRCVNMPVCVVLGGCGEACGIRKTREAGKETKEQAMNDWAADDHLHLSLTAPKTLLDTQDTDNTQHRQAVAIPGVQQASLYKRLAGPSRFHFAPPRLPHASSSSSCLSARIDLLVSIPTIYTTHRQTG